MTTLTTDFAALWAACDSSPLDDGRKLILADALAESGDESTERAVRWAAARGRWPYWTGGTQPHWSWCSGHDWFTSEYKRASIPSFLFGWMTKQEGAQWERVYGYVTTVARSARTLLWRLGQALDAHPEEL